MLRAGRSGIRISVRARDFYLLETVQTGYGARPSSEFLSGVYSGRDLMLANHLHLTMRFGKSGAIYLLLLYAFMTLGANSLSFTPE